MPKLSVCITTFERWESCHETLKSIHNQSEKDIEIILVDDCSPTRMPEALRSYIKDWTVVYIRHEENRGLSTARNTAIQHSSGKYFSFCDDDDTWPRDMASRMLEVMKKAPSDVKLAVVLDESRKYSCHSILSGYPSLISVMKNGFTPPVSSQIYRTEILNKCGGYSENIKSGVDHDLWISLAEFDPNVAVCWGESANICDDFSAVRLTTIESKRRKNIHHSLNVWEPKIVRIFGMEFYKYFKESYKQYLNFNFFVKAVHNKNYIDAIWRVVKYNLYSVIFSKVYLKLSGQRQCNTFPRFYD
jgi:glycosyltransferase involved in cell wall biosynthesis